MTPLMSVGAADASTTSERGGSAPMSHLRRPAYSAADTPGVSSPWASSCANGRGGRGGNDTALGADGLAAWAMPHQFGVRQGATTSGCVSCVGWPTEMGPSASRGSEAGSASAAAAAEEDEEASHSALGAVHTLR